MLGRGIAKNDEKNLLYFTECIAITTIFISTFYFNSECMANEHMVKNLSMSLLPSHETTGKRFSTLDS